MAVHPHHIEITPVAGRVSIEVDGEVVADSDDVLALSEGRLPTRYYFPRADVRMDRLAPSESQTQCPFKGEASYYDLGGRHDFVWYYPDPIPAVEAIRDRLAFYNDRVLVLVDGEPEE